MNLEIGINHTMGEAGDDGSFPHWLIEGDAHTEGQEEEEEEDELKRGVWNSLHASCKSPGKVTRLQ